MRRTGARAVAALVLAATAAGCSSSGTDRGQALPPVRTSAPAAAPVAPLVPSPSIRPRPGEVVVDCDGRILLTDPPTGPRRVLDAVELPVDLRLEVGQPGPTPVRQARYWTKYGLSVRPGARVDVVVPKAWRHRVWLWFGNLTEPTQHLVLPPCERIAEQPQSWIVFAGGYLVSRPACVPLDVTADGRRQRVRIALGADCPGAAPSG